MLESGGCMSKVSGVELCSLINNARLQEPSLSDAYLTAIADGQIDDAAILPIATEKIISTVDFGPPVGKDLKVAGMIAALNAISDIYAMGGVPKYAMIILQLAKALTTEEKKEILSGLYSACFSEKVFIVGGHTINGAETVAGLAVIGEPRKDVVIAKHSCKIGDIIMLSKAIGTGMALRGYYHGLLKEETYEEAIQIALKSNSMTDEIIVSPYIHAITDVTGFGLIGHLSEMLDNDMGAKIHLNDVPLLNAVLTLDPFVMKNHQIVSNYEYASNKHRIHGYTDDMRVLALFDPQTNGPLLICVNQKLVQEAQKQGFTYIGEVTAGNEIILDNNTSAVEKDIEG